MEVSFFIALFGGIISFISPCVLPMIPMYIAYISGISVKEIEGGNKPVFRILINSVVFVLGFTIVFTTLAALFYLFAANLGQFKVWFERIAGLILIVFGLHIMGVISIPFLNYQAQMSNNKKDPTLISSFIMGVVFGAGWTPCIGPILAGILFSSAAADNIVKAVLLLVVYSLGIGIPFILTGLATKGLMNMFKSIKKHYKIIEIISGIFLIALGILLFFGWMNVISSLGGESDLEMRLADNEPPRIRVQSPDDGDILTGDTFTLQLKIRDEVGVQSLFISDNGEFIEYQPEAEIWSNELPVQTETYIFATDKKGQVSETNLIYLQEKDDSYTVFIDPDFPITE